MFTINPNKPAWPSRNILFGNHFGRTNAPKQDVASFGQATALEEVSTPANIPTDTFAFSRIRVAQELLDEYSQGSSELNMRAIR